MRTTGLAWIAFVVGAGACTLAEDPQYINPAPPLNSLESDPGQMMPPSAIVYLPIDMRRIAEDEMDRLALATELGLDPTLVPTVRNDDLDIALEWSLKNLDPMNESEVSFEIWGGTEYFALTVDYAAFAEEDEDPPPPLLGDQAPIHIEPDGVVTGVFREDQIREAALDIDQVTRGNINYVAAHLSLGDDEKPDFQPLSPLMFDMNGEPLPQTATGPAIPRAAWAEMIQFNISFTASTRTVLEYTIRVRDKRNLLHDELLDGIELVTFMPAMCAISIESTMCM
jgi:hypothetical protein